MTTITRQRLRNLKNRVRQPLLLLLAIIVLCSHDLYIHMETYFLRPHQEATLSLFNGTFEKSENVIARDRMLDASVVAHGKRTAIDPQAWQDRDSTLTQLNFSTGESGTYVAGVSTRARNLELAAEKFNSYLEHDGVLDMLEYRATHQLLHEDAVESYQKHVKAIYQVGDKKTNDWNTVFGYPIEFVPQTNPYDKYQGDSLEIQLLLDGVPLPNQLVYADHIQNGHDHSHDTHGHAHTKKEESHSHTQGQQLRTNDNGVVEVKLPAEGIYYLRTIYMTRVTDDEELTHRSKWATLTFEVSHEHGPDTHTHNHDHDHHHDHSLPTWVFVLGSILIIGLLFVIFRKKN